MPTTTTLIALSWAIFLLVWLVAAFFTKRTAERQPIRDRIAYSALFMLAFWLMINGIHDSRIAIAMPPPLYPLYVAVLPRNLIVNALGLAITGLGLVLLLWSRLVIGGNWSGIVTYKQDHRLIQHGPYSYVRHPIYTGLLMMFLGTAVTFGNLGGFLGFPILALSFWIKLKQEEALMISHFGEAYTAYRVRVKALIPHVF